MQNTKDDKHPACIAAAESARWEIIQSRRNYEAKLAANTKADKKSFFAYASSKGNSRARAGPLLTDEGLTESTTETSEAFNKYFASVFTSEDVSHVPDAERVYTGADSDRLHDITIYIYKRGICQK